MMFSLPTYICESPRHIHLSRIKIRDWIPTWRFFYNTVIGPSVVECRIKQHQRKNHIDYDKRMIPFQGIIKFATKNSRFIVAMSLQHMEDYYPWKLSLHLTCPSLSKVQRFMAVSSCFKYRSGHLKCHQNPAYTCVHTNLKWLYAKHGHCQSRTWWLLMCQTCCQ